MLKNSLYVVGFFLWLAGLAYADLVLRWQDNSAVETRYEVVRQAQNQRNFYSVAVLPSNTTSWADRTTQRNRTYCYMVIAYANQQRGFSNVACQKDNGRDAPITITWSGDGWSGKLTLDLGK
jgi:hypothetical protein